ncbi:6-phospho-3-hexuloisomerase [Bombilactobacillus bombi]|jgi:6-phospho-3-hexuloisomerase|uniref:6-phospho-3-hexuloisomerase n=1 Tax=Bombilactobacillus bombi TaxID=1303590 RepID=A0A3R6YU50_9LACO|nr:6-phospho-3-hexuloisomerase [Bombilactobacillus bombi]RHW52163.1 6-phospho-3-hexuloisomerase [Bombilactobacillus bombi]
MSELTNILNELDSMTDPLINNDIDKLIDSIISAKRIYLSGVGRSGLMIKAFANRLMQLGFTISVVGEISGPHTHHGDLIIFNSASGSSSNLISQAKIARDNKVKVAVITTNETSELAQQADLIIEIKAQSKFSQSTSIQPMGSLFEQSTLLLFDSLSLKLMKIMGINEQDMLKNHANLE